MLVDGVKITSIGLDDLTESEAQNYIDYVRERVETPLKELEVELCDDGKIDLRYNAQGDKFERIRRITGYLTGDLNSWNNAKRTEEHERVKHDVLV